MKCDVRIKQSNPMIMDKTIQLYVYDNGKSLFKVEKAAHSRMRHKHHGSRLSDMTETVVF